MPKTMKRIEMGSSEGSIQFGFEQRKVLAIRSVVDYYWGLRILVHTWAKIGNFIDEEFEKRSEGMLDEAHEL